MLEEKHIQKEEKSKIAETVRKTIGILLLIAGVIMLVIPGPGWLAIILGTILLGEDSKVGRWIISKLPHRVREEIKKRQKRN